MDSKITQMEKEKKMSRETVKTYGGVTISKYIYDACCTLVNCDGLHADDDEEFTPLRQSDLAEVAPGTFASTLVHVIPAKEKRYLWERHIEEVLRFEMLYTALRNAGALS